jgi:hypothetical protein
MDKLQDVLALFHVSPKRCMGAMHDDVRLRSPYHLQATHVHVWLLANCPSDGYRMDAVCLQTQFV